MNHSQLHIKQRKTRPKANDCPVCKSPISVKPSAYKKIKGLLTCSKKCRGLYLKTTYKGNNNPNTKYASPIEKYFAEKYQHIKGTAKKRDFDFNLTREYLLELWNKQNGKCYYTKLSLKLITDHDNFGGYDQPDLDVLSVDRLDSSKGYIIGNVVYACNGINKMKGSVPELEFHKFLDILFKTRGEGFVSDNKLNMLQVFKLDPKAVIPTRARSTDAGLDLYALESAFISPGETVKIKTGIALNVPENYVAKIEDRSGLASKGLRTGGGVIDFSYNGDVTVVMHNISNITHLKEDIGFHPDKAEFGYRIEAGDKVAQVLLYKVETPQVEEVTELWTSERGNKGFASSGW